MTAPQPVDLLIKARWVIPVVPENQVFEHCAVAVADGRIEAVVPQTEADKRFNAETVIELAEHVLIPGLINAHGHSAMSLMRGYADDKPLQTWLEDYIWPAEGKWVNEDFIHDGSQLAMAEMIRGGTTCFADMYFFPNITAALAQQTGLRAQINAPVLDFPTVWADNADEYISKALTVHDDFRSSELVRVGFGPHAPYTVSDAPLQRIAMLAEELQAPIQIHVHETAFEVEQAQQQHGKRPMQRLQELNLLSPLCQCVHMTQVVDDDVELLQQSGAHVVHCPESNLKLASGFCPLDRLLQADINVAIGTDGAASNNDLDLLAEIRSAALLAKAVAGNAAAVDAHQALRLATINGAKCLGLEQEIGSLEAGKSADLTAIRIEGLDAVPLFDPASHLVYTHNTHRVSDVWVRGKALMRERELQTLNVAEIELKAREWQERMREM